MRFKEFLAQEAETKPRVHTIRNPNIKPRGAPEDRARAFDTKNVDRSVLKKLAMNANKFYVIQGDMEFHDWSDDKNDELMKFGNYVRLHVMGGNTEHALATNKYHGISVFLPLKDTKLELDPSSPADLHTSDGIARKQALGYAKAIVQACLDALKKNDVPGVYSGLGGHEYNIEKIDGIDEWAAAQLRHLKNNNMQDDE